MTSYPIDIRLTDEYISVGPVAIVLRGSQVDTLVRVLGKADRILPITYNNALVNTLYIYDHFGIRFWAKGDIVSELQIVLETEKRETFPAYSFLGPLDYKGHIFLPPVSNNLLVNGDLNGFVQDTDRLQYNRQVYVDRTPLIKYTVLISNITNNVKYISIS
ncbi:MAG: hypothetical protein M3Y54_13245 [Bacteroidota bacterium]|nr:hypothetical protein [Bacteroidota bacterium]